MKTKRNKSTIKPQVNFKYILFHFTFLWSELQLRQPRNLTKRKTLRWRIQDSTV